MGCMCTCICVFVCCIVICFEAGSHYLALELAVDQADLEQLVSEIPLWVLGLNMCANTLGTFCSRFPRLRQYLPTRLETRKAEKSLSISHLCTELSVGVLSRHFSINFPLILALLTMHKLSTLNGRNHY